MNDLCRIYEKDGSTYLKALEWYRKAADAGYAPAMDNLGWVWRNSRAAGSANGKQTCSPVTGAVTILRLSLRLLLISCTRAFVGVGS